MVRTGAEVPQLEVKLAGDFRRWLQEHHQEAAAVWVVFYKRHHQDHVPVRALMDEALCFGWIDSTLRRIDEDRSMLRFSPRTPTGHWSSSNKQAVARLEAAGQMTDAGRAVVQAAKQSGTWNLLNDVEKGVVPEDLAAVLRENPQARNAFDSYPASKQKQLLYWVKSAKKEETRRRRISDLVRRAESESSLG